MFQAAQEGRAARAGLLAEVGARGRASSQPPDFLGACCLGRVGGTRPRARERVLVVRNAKNSAPLFVC